MYNTHENGPWIVIGNKLQNQITKLTVDANNVAILIDNEVEQDVGVLLKVGTFEQVNSYYHSLINQFSYGNPIANVLLAHYQVIKFNLKDISFYEVNEDDEFNNELNIHEICTVLNWFNNSIGGNMGTFLNMSLFEAKKKLYQLSSIGF